MNITRTYAHLETRVVYPVQIDYLAVLAYQMVTTPFLVDIGPRTILIAIETGLLIFYSVNKAIISILRPKFVCQPSNQVLSIHSNVPN